MTDNRSLYYMAPMVCTPWIVLYGILSYNKIQQPLPIPPNTHSIADPFVQCRRDRRIIGNASVHDYVPLYWAVHTPMQYVVTIKSETKRLEEEDLVFFVFDSDQILALNGVVSTDGNAASDDTRFYKGNGALTSIDWKIIETENCYSKEYRRKKCAEVLVPNNLSPDFIKHVCVKSENAKNRLKTELSRVNQIAQIHGFSMKSIDPEIDKSLYNPMADLIKEICASLDFHEKHLD